MSNEGAGIASEGTESVYLHVPGKPFLPVIPGVLGGTTLVLGIFTQIFTLGIS